MRFSWLRIVVVLSSLVVSVSLSAQTVNVWLTTDDKASKMAPQPAISFAATSADAAVVYVDENATYQGIDGFGASLTDSAAYLMNEKIPSAQRSTVMNKLFSYSSGIGVSFLRNPMGASDIARYDYSYDDGGADPTLARFSISHDLTDIIPLVKSARQINPQLKLMMNPWSPPGWMKTSGNMIGGSLLAADYSTYANYFVKTVKAYAAQGVTINYLSMQNEPLYVPSNYPGMCMPATTSDTSCGSSPTDETSQIKATLTALKSAGLTTKLMIYDHNWDRPDYPKAVLSDSTINTSTQIAGVAWHGYSGTPGAMSALHDAYPNVGNYETEHSGGTWVNDQVRQDFEEIIQSMRNWAKSYVKWSLALDPGLGPHTGGCGTCNPLITVNETTGAVTYDIEYYTLGQFSKFVKPGALRIWSSNAPGFVSVAFKNTDGSKVLVVYNDTTAARSFQAQWGTQKFTYSLPSLSGATFVWSGTQPGTFTVGARRQIQASSYSREYGLETETTSDASGGYDLGFSDTGDWAMYRNISFGTGVTGAKVRVASGGTGGTLEFHLDSATGTLLGTANLPVTGGWQTWQTVTAPIVGASGVHNLYLVFKGGNGIANVNWFVFQ